MRFRFLVLVFAVMMTVTACGPINWPAFMFDDTRTSFNGAAVAITPANAANLVAKWKFSPDPPTQPGQPGPALNATPVTYGGVIYVGAETGMFYAVNEHTGAVAWKQFLGFAPPGACPGGEGVESTASVNPEPSDGASTVYVGGGDGYVYALNAANGALRWKTPVAVQTAAHANAFLWSSPAVANGRVYIGIATQCDNEPTVPGAGVVALDQATGAPVATYFTEPPGVPGAGVWSSVAVDPSDGSLFVTTGNPQLSPDPGDGNAILHLNGQTLARLDKWTVPPGQQVPDGDFGASPVLFSLGTQQRVGACNKNGIFYAFARSALAAGPVWQQRVGAPVCLSGAAVDGTHLYIGGLNTTISGVAYPGSLRALDPGSGDVLWKTGLPGGVWGTPTVNGSGVVAASTAFYSATNATDLFDAHTGTIVKTFNTNGVFAQAVWADDMLIVATQNNGLQGYGLP